MKLTIDEIAELAEDLGSRNIFGGKVNLTKIARVKHIEIIYGNYEQYFDGLLCHEGGKFYMHINLDKVPNKESERMRFTIAHELGHYFIDDHRKKLEQGISLSFQGELTVNEKNIEKEANHFASHLLMPRELFNKYAKKFEPGLEVILNLKNRFKTSVYSTTIQYINFNLSSSIMIKWKSDFSFHYASYSNNFSILTGVKGKPLIGFPVNYIKEVANVISENSVEFYEVVTPLSRWFPFVIPGSLKDIIGVEQTIILGDYGGITLLTFL